MLRKFLRSKIHRATVTACDLAYEGSITIDSNLMEAAGLMAHEAVDVYDVTNGNRFETYAVPGKAGSGEIQVNGAACRLASPGDLVIIACYGYFTRAEASRHAPSIVLVDERNQIARTADSDRGVNRKALRSFGPAVHPEPLPPSGERPQGAMRTLP